MNEKILVINPIDHCSGDRDIFKVIYEGKGYDVIEDADISDDELTEKLRSHDVIVFLRIVNEDGLLVWGTNGKSRYILDDTHVDLLRDKRLLSIEGKRFFEKHGLAGLHTGTILTSSFAACLYDIEGYSDEYIKESLKPLMLAIRDTLEMEDPQEMKRIILERYNADDAITQFNRNNIIVL